MLAPSSFNTVKPLPDELEISKIKDVSLLQLSFHFSKISEVDEAVADKSEGVKGTANFVLA